MKRIKLFLFSLFSPSFWPHSLQPIVALLFCVHFLYFALDKMSCSFFFWCGKTPEYIRITLDTHKIQIKQIFSMEIRNDCWKNNDGVKRIMCKWMVCVCWCMCGGKIQKNNNNLQGCGQFASLAKWARRKEWQNRKSKDIEFRKKCFRSESPAFFHK